MTTRTRTLHPWPRPVLQVLAALLAPAALLAGCGGEADPASPGTPSAAASTGPTSERPGASTPEVPRPGKPAPQAVPPTGPPTPSSGLPEGFPAAEIPVIAGEVLRASPGDPGAVVAYTVILRVPGGEPAAVMRRIVAGLQRAGFTVETTPSTPRTSSATFRNPSYEVGVNVIRARARTTVTYVVLRR